MELSWITLMVRSGGSGQARELCFEARFLDECFAASRSIDPILSARSISTVRSASEAEDSRSFSSDRSKDIEGVDSSSSRHRNLCSICSTWSRPLPLLWSCNEEEEGHGRFEEQGNVSIAINPLLLHASARGGGGGYGGDGGYGICYHYHTPVLLVPFFFFRGYRE